MERVNDGKCADCRVVPKILGPLVEYDERVHSRRLRDDEYQRCMAPTI
jgi:hypothetical protein